MAKRIFTKLIDEKKAKGYTEGENGSPYQQADKKTSGLLLQLCKGRSDALFFADLPNQAEREAFWRIEVAKFGSEPSDFDVMQLARATNGLTGSEIEQLFTDALHEAFSQRGDDRPLRHHVVE